MSRVIRFHQFGPAEVLKIEEQPVRQPVGGEVLVRVEAIGVNWGDVLWRQDLAPRHAQLPAGLGSELAGEVLAVGGEVADFKVGERVASFLGHSINEYPAYGERMLMPASSLAHYPAVLSAEQAAVHYMPLLIAYFGFTEVARMSAGQRVLITDASHCSGPSSVQMAKALGAQVFATCGSSDDREFLLGLGADQVIATEEEDLVGRIRKLTGGQGVDVVLDGCGGPQMGLLGDIMAPRGKLILYGLNGGNQTSFPACAAFEKNFKFFVHCLADFTGSPELGIQPDREAVERALAQINQMTRDVLLRACIDSVFAFADVVAAHRRLESGDCRGRVVLKV